MKGASEVDPFNNAIAFGMMFNDVVKVTGVRQGRTIRGSYAACSFPIHFDDPFEEDKMQSTRQRFSVMIAKSGPRSWNDKSSPQIGDEIVLTNGLKTSVVKVSPVVGDWYEMEVRQS